MVVGLQERDYQTDTGIYDFVQLNRDAKKLLEERGAKVDYREKKDAIYGAFGKGTSRIAPLFLKRLNRA